VVALPSAETKWEDSSRRIDEVADFVGHEKLVDGIGEEQKKQEPGRDVVVAAANCGYCEGGGLLAGIVRIPGRKVKVC
jgi:hypothetical protein